MTDQQYQDLLNHANNWRYLMAVASEDMTKDQLWKLHKATTKGDLDAWLMSCFGLDAMEARTISNYSMDNIDFRAGNSVRWVARRIPPTWEDYPELAAMIERIKS